MAQTLVKCPGNAVRLNVAPAEVMGGAGGNLLPTLCFGVETLKEEKCYPKVIKEEPCTTLLVLV